MSKQIIPGGQTAIEAAQTYFEARRTPNTRRNYESDWRIFEEWAKGQGANTSEPRPALVGLFCAAQAQAGLSPSTIARRVSAIAYHYHERGLGIDTRHSSIKEVMRGIRNTHKNAKQPKKPITREILRSILHRNPLTRRQLRDNAVLLVGWTAAMRRSEIVGIDVEHLSFEDDGMIVNLAWSKTDESREGVEIVVPVHSDPDFCAVEAVRSWLSVAKIASGPVFRTISPQERVLDRRMSDRAVARLIKRRIGDDAGDFSGHSLRAGLVTEALDNDIDAYEVMKFARHTKIETTKMYDRRRANFQKTITRDLL